MLSCCVDDCAGVVGRLAKLGCVDVHVRNVPVDLLEEFDSKVVVGSYPGGRSEAIRDLMRREIEKRK